MSKTAAVGTQPRVLMVAITSGAAALKDGTTVVFHAGETFDQDDPLVRACPLYFIGAWATTQEIRQAQADRRVLVQPAVL
jgi:hypothetical protein